MFSGRHHRFCFPSEREDDPLMQLVLSPKEALPYAEERRLFYVALTRARDHLWVSSPLAEGEKRLKKETRPSFFTDLLRSGRTYGIIAEVREPGNTRASASAGPMNETAVYDIEEALRQWTMLRAAAEAGDLDARSASRPLETITWAALARYDICPFAFRLDRSARNAGARDEVSSEGVSGDMPTVELPKGIDPAEFGAFVHAVLERRDDIEALESSVNRMAARYDFGPHAAAVMDLARARIAGACAAGLAGASGGAQSELPFSVRIHRVLMHGVIDRLDTLKDGALVTDYKLGSPHASHHFQVAVYAWAVQRILGAGTVRARLVYLGYDPIRVEEVETDHARIGALVDAMAKSLESEEFTAKPGDVCATCEHRSHCAFAAVTETPVVQS
jgi:ATP-dependent exoDNAse (exonuclease V) beta subunit